MPSVLGIVPLVGRAEVALGPFNETTPLRRSVETVAPVVGRPVVILAEGGQVMSAMDALDGCSVPVDIWDVDVARDIKRLRAAAQVTDLILVHDPLCPLVTTESLVEVLASTATGEAAVAVRPVVDTLKTLVRSVITATVDREALRVVISPVVLPAALLDESLDPALTLDEPALLVQWLRERVHVRLVMAPAGSGRITDLSSSRMMMAADLLG